MEYVSCNEQATEYVSRNEQKAEYVSHSEQETENIGAELSRNLCAGDVIAFRGGLGMGKTAFVRGLARGLGYSGRVTSPTFTIVNEYEGGRLPLFHFDLYRLSGAGELWDLGWDEYRERGGVCAVEWSEQAPEAFPPDTVYVTLERGSDGDMSRRVTVANPKEGMTITNPKESVTMRSPKEGAAT